MTSVSRTGTLTPRYTSASGRGRTLETLDDLTVNGVNIVCPNTFLLSLKIRSLVIDGDNDDDDNDDCKKSWTSLKVIEQISPHLSFRSEL